MPRTGGLSPLTWESCSPESEACFCSPINHFLKISRSSSAATRTSRFCAAIHSRARWTLPVTSCGCHVPRPSWTRYTCSCTMSRARSNVRGCELPRRSARCELPRWNCAIWKLKKNDEFENKSKPRFRVNRIPRSGVKDPLYWGTGLPLVRGMG